ncbi:MAG: acyltransferase [Thermodesulfobacteriota bacterium]|nr:acyltransferase [Thermodesulfobacteriota bacterium]
MERHVNPLLRWCISKFYKIFSRLLDEIAEEQKEGLKSRFKRCGKHVRLNGRICISGPEDVEIGDNVHIGDNAFIRAEGGLVIGDNTHISRNLVCYTINHDYTGQCLPYDNNMIKKRVVIGRNVWIGMNVTIIPGVTIGDGAVIGLGTNVSSDVPPLAIVGSAKHRIIKYRDKDHYDRLNNARKYGGINGRPLDNDDYVGE